MIYLFLTSIIWSFSFGLIKSELSGFNPYLVSFIRLSLSLIIFLPFLKRISKENALKLIFIGMIQFGLMYCLYIYSYKFLQGHQVALLTITTPLYLVFFEGILNKNWPAKFWLSAILAVVAALILVMEKGSFEVALLGLLLLQGANICFALGQLLYKKLKPSLGPSHHHFAWTYLGAVITPTIFLLITGNDNISIPYTTSQWLGLLYLGIIPSGIGFFLWNKGVTKVNSGTAAVMNNLKIPLAALVAWAIFQETINLPKFLISALLLGMAFYLTQRKWKNN